MNDYSEQQKNQRIMKEQEKHEILKIVYAAEGIWGRICALRKRNYHVFSSHDLHYLWADIRELVTHTRLLAELHEEWIGVWASFSKEEN